MEFLLCQGLTELKSALAAATETSNGGGGNDSLYLWL
jgi:hypothetical protein